MVTAKGPISQRIIVNFNTLASKAEHGDATTMPIPFNFIDTTGAAAEGGGPCPVTCFGIYGHGVGMFLFCLQGPNFQVLLNSLGNGAP